MKKLYILRHAKAELGDIGMDDHARPLAERGRKNAAELARYLTLHDMLPNNAISSTANRTRQTIELLNGELQTPVPTQFTDELYLADAGHIIRTIQESGATDDTLMVVGHNPGLHHLSLVLAPDGESQARNDIAIKFPTCAMAVIECKIEDWNELEPNIGYLAHFITRKNYSH